MRYYTKDEPVLSGYFLFSLHYNFNCVLRSNNSFYFTEICNKDLITAVKKGYVENAKFKLETCASPDAEDEG